jgi:hypothetical protein
MLPPFYNTYIFTNYVLNTSSCSPYLIDLTVYNRTSSSLNLQETSENTRMASVLEREKKSGKCSHTCRFMTLRRRHATQRGRRRLIGSTRSTQTHRLLALVRLVLGLRLRKQLSRAVEDCLANHLPHCSARTPFTKRALSRS